VQSDPVLVVNQMRPVTLRSIRTIPSELNHQAKRSLTTTTTTTTTLVVVFVIIIIIIIIIIILDPRYL